MKDYTADGVKIVPGLRVWSNDLRVVTVKEPDRYDEGWWYTTGGMFNGERMAVRHPFTREVAK